MTDCEKLAHFVYLRQRGARGSATRDFKRLFQRVEARESDRLIENGPDDYHDDEEEAGSADQSTSQPPSGASEDGVHHRVEPSSLGGVEANQWRS